MSENPENINNNVNKNNYKNIYSYNKTFSSFKGVINELEPDIFALRTTLDLTEETFHNLVIIVTEGFNNAVRHGNKHNPDKYVNINLLVKEININEFLIEIEIHDQGIGYDIDKVEDPRLPENILKTGGRGVFLIKELSKFVSYTKVDNGNKLFIQFEYFK